MTPQDSSKDREAIAKILSENIHFSGQVDGYVIHGAIDEIIKWADARYLHPSPSGWISCKEQLPDAQQEVLAFEPIFHRIVQQSCGTDRITTMKLGLSEPSRIG